jgi:hypothetical protein
VASVLVLVMGMVFASQSFRADTASFVLLNIATAAVIIGSTGSFVVLLVFEVYRSIRVSGCPCLCCPCCPSSPTPVSLPLSKLVMALHC